MSLNSEVGQCGNLPFQGISLCGKALALQSTYSSATKQSFLRGISMSKLPDLFRNSFPSRRENPFRAMARMQHEMDKMFEGFMGNNSPDSIPDLSQRSFEPLYEVKDMGSHFLLSFDIPGFSKDDIKVEAQGNQLHIFGERKAEHEEKKDRNFESSYGSIEQWLTLPQNANADMTEARIEHGVLTIAIPKAESSLTKQIPVNEEKAGFFSKVFAKKDRVA
jgi:HSP20 family protein